MTDDTLFLTINQHDRLGIATTIERLINMLDALEPDPDLEETGDEEASLGWTERGPGASGSTFDDREAENEHDEETGDDEPWLGAPEGKASRSQAHWAAGHYDDREDDGDDLEPSLGGMGQYYNGKFEYDLEGGPTGDDEPNGDFELSLGWSNPGGATVAEVGWSHYDGDNSEGTLDGFIGDGHREGRELLRGLKQNPLPTMNLAERMHQNVRLLNGDELRVIAPGIARVGF